MNGWLEWFGGLGGIAVFGQLVWLVVKGVRGKETRRMQAEASKAAIDAEQAEAALPYVQKSLELGNIAEAVTVQQTVINGLREHSRWQDEQIKARDAEVSALREQLDAKDELVGRLQTRLTEAEEALQQAWVIIRELKPDDE